MDLYKLIILASILLIPAAGGWAYWQSDRLEVAKKSVRDASKRKGSLVSIGRLQREIDEIRKNSRGNESTNHIIYFENRITKSARGDSIKATDIQIGDEQHKNQRKLRASDYEVSIKFERNNKPMELSREFIHAVLFNCEAFSKAWRLRGIELSNAEAGKATGRKPPPKTVADNWLVNRLVFARREPAKKKG